ncbi:hypothetical protein CERZMDRAFT_86383 [Cercospora zeae-maydis SCOH1-5]|uniref:Uncharacterized protein n=1 Tax=Cercospora zeae-maydis SCOH1-5 TaxID=717836 RepID=A0A6A6F9M9_9PEZI|nr:hypothetical protein CERZMDRAFT_86383 [Cercospora zeae-maydis SCOH1-5]
MPHAALLMVRRRLVHRPCQKPLSTAVVHHDQLPGTASANVAADASITIDRHTVCSSARVHWWHEQGWSFFRHLSPLWASAIPAEHPGAAHILDLCCSTLLPTQELTKPCVATSCLSPNHHIHDALLFSVVPVHDKIWKTFVNLHEGHDQAAAVEANFSLARDSRK